MKILGFVALLLLTLAVALLIAGEVGFLSGTPPQNLGVTDGRLLKFDTISAVISDFRSSQSMKSSIYVSFVGQIQKCL